MQPTISAMVASSERMRFFLGLEPSGERLRISCTMAVAMVARAPMMAATMVSERPIPGDLYDKTSCRECIPGGSRRSAGALATVYWFTQWPSGSWAAGFVPGVVALEPGGPGVAPIRGFDE